MAIKEYKNCGQILGKQYSLVVAQPIRVLGGASLSLYTSCYNLQHHRHKLLCLIVLHIDIGMGLYFHDGDTLQSLW